MSKRNIPSLDRRSKLVTPLIPAIGYTVPVNYSASRFKLFYQEGISAQCRWLAFIHTLKNWPLSVDAPCAHPGEIIATIAYCMTSADNQRLTGSRVQDSNALSSRSTPCYQDCNVKHAVSIEVALGQEWVQPRRKQVVLIELRPLKNSDCPSRNVLPLFPRGLLSSGALGAKCAKKHKNPKRNTSKVRSLSASLSRRFKLTHCLTEHMVDNM
jgi:hypothetical protein